MKSAMATVRANTIQRLMYQEKEKILNAFALDSSIKRRAITRVAKLILLNGPYLFGGQCWEIKSKSLGAGVHELSAELKK